MSQNATVSSNDASPDDAIRRTLNRLVADGFIASYDHRSRCGSTNTEANEWLRRSPETDVSTQNVQLPRLIVADKQTSGRGRLGRVWTAQEDGLAFSLLWKGCHSLLSIAVGVAIAEAIEFVAGPTSCGLKWPNDIWMNGRKVGGVLIERIGLSGRDCGSNEGDGEVSIIGIGLNVRSSPDIDGTATTSIVETTGKVIARSDLLEELVSSLIQRLNFIQNDPEGVIRDFAKRCILSGTPVRCWIGGAQVEGMCEGISSTGELIVHTSDGVQRCRSGDVTRVRHSQ